MSKSTFISLPRTMLAALLLHNSVFAKSKCNTELFLKFPDVAISSVQHENLPVPHCKIKGVIGTEIGFELLLPEQWNGKFVMGGGGGFVGSVVNSSLMFGSLQAGYATVGTDTGHQGHVLDAHWAHNNLERLVNFGYEAVRRTAVTAKAATRIYYQTSIDRSYFTGCSRGGGQGLMAAQRYPELFDGIVVGAPAYNWTGLAALTQIAKAMYPDPKLLDKALIGPSEQILIESSYLEKCDDLDGLKDGILNDPRQCEFDVSSLKCQDEKNVQCLSQEQISAVNVIYHGPKDSTGKALYNGFPLGAETSNGGWPLWLTGGLAYQHIDKENQERSHPTSFSAPVVPNLHYAFGLGIMKYFIYNNPSWSYVDYNYDLLEKDAELAGNTLNANSPDLSEFRRQGGKLLIYSGWSDTAIPAASTIDYYDSVIFFDKTAVDDVRLYMLPGVEHCIGGAGPSYVNFLNEIDNWVKSGKAPEKAAAYWLDEDGKTSGSRLICAYPKVALYDGHGNPRNKTSFSCALPEK